MIAWNRVSTRRSSPPGQQVLFGLDDALLIDKFHLSLIRKPTGSAGHGLVAEESGSARWMLPADNVPVSLLIDVFLSVKLQMIL